MIKKAYEGHTFGLAFGVAALALILLVSGVGAAPFDNHKTEIFHGKEAVASEVLVKFRAAAPQEITQAEIKGDVDETEYVGSGQLLRFHSRSKNVTTLIGELSGLGEVEYVEPNYIVYAIATPNDPSFGQLWGLQNTGQSILGIQGMPGADISATSAWDISTGTKANVVAVVDTGIDYTHPDLAANTWSAPSDFTVTIAGRSITCKAGSHGFNAITNTCDPMDDNDHGTHVSGTIGAAGNNGQGVVGVNWNASIMGSKFLNARGSGTLANAINAIEFVIQTKALFGGATGSANVRVLSNSWGGGGFSQSLLDEINKANANDMLFVAAAGNSGSNNDVTPFYPSNYNAPNVIAVAATDNKDSKASFSNYGHTTVHLGAPGVLVLSTIISGNYAYFDGTSMATPHVSGAAILILSKCALNTAGLKANILDNVDPIPSMSGITVTGGRLNVNKAIRACSAPPAPDFSLSASPGSISVIQGSTATSTITVSALNGFTGTVALSVSGIPSGASASLSPPSVTNSGTSTLTVNAGTAATGSYILTITGTNGTLIHTTTVGVTITVTPPPDFSLSASPASRTVTRGGSTSYTVTIARLSGFAEAVNFSVTGLPSGVSATFSPNPTTGTSSTLSVVTRSTTLAGSYLLTITGTSGSITHTTSVTLIVKKRRN